MKKALQLCKHFSCAWSQGASGYWLMATGSWLIVSESASSQKQEASGQNTDT